jgi:hypothetical protein
MDEPSLRSRFFGLVRSRVREGVDRLRQLENLIGPVEELLVLLVLSLDGLPLLVGNHLALASALFWLIITKVERKIASSAPRPPPGRLQIRGGFTRSARAHWGSARGSP